MNHDNGGYDCPGCAWPDDRHGLTMDICENGIKHASWELTKKRATPDFFAAHTVAELSGWSDFALEDAGRLTEPMRYDAASDKYVPVSRDEGFALVGRHSASGSNEVSASRVVSSSSTAPLLDGSSDPRGGSNRSCFRLGIISEVMTMFKLPFVARSQPSQPQAQPFSPRTAEKSSRLRGATVTEGLCPYCAVGCSQLIYTKRGQLIDIEGDPRSPINEGTLCPKGSKRVAPGCQPAPREDCPLPGSLLREMGDPNPRLGARPDRSPRQSGTGCRLHGARSRRSHAELSAEHGNARRRDVEHRR